MKAQTGDGGCYGSVKPSPFVRHQIDISSPELKSKTLTLQYKVRVLYPTFVLNEFFIRLVMDHLDTCQYVYVVPFYTHMLGLNVILTVRN